MALIIIGCATVRSDLRLGVTLNSVSVSKYACVIYYVLSRVLSTRACELLPRSNNLSQAGDTRIPLPRASLWTPQEIVDCKVGLCTSLRTVTEFL